MPQQNMQSLARSHPKVSRAPALRLAPSSPVLSPVISSYLSLLRHWTQVPPQALSESLPWGKSLKPPTQQTGTVDGFHFTCLHSLSNHCLLLPIVQCLKTVISCILCFLNIYFCLLIYLSLLDLSCSMWDLITPPRIEPGPPALGARSLSHWTGRKVPCLPFQLLEAEALILSLLLPHD